MKGAEAFRLQDAIPEPVVAVGAGNRVLDANAAFRRLGVEPGEVLAAPESRPVTVLAGRRFTIERLAEDGDRRFLRLHPDSELASRGRAIAAYLDGLNDGKDPLHAALDGIWRGVAWRWSFVTRFNPRMLKQVQVLFGAEYGELIEPFDYRVEGTPCERVFAEDEAGGCRLFSDLPREFPDDPWIGRVGAREYVGRVYRTREGVPLGHLFTISDRDGIGVREARSAISLLSHLVSAQLQAMSWGELVDRATHEANRDPLTRVASRLAYERALDYHERRRGSGAPELTVVWLDLDGMKQINDTLGHEEGDRLLITFAHHLSSEIRRCDSLFRVGGDEFVMMLESGFERSSLERRIGRVVEVLAEHGFEGVAVSYGAAALREAGGDLREAIRLADQRMYAMKRGRGPGRRF